MRASRKSGSKQKPASLGDVARLAGVSPQTASRVSTGSSQVARDTEARVREAMEQLGYTPNPAARSLRGGEYKAIGVVTQQVERTGESLMTSGIVNEAEKRGYTVTLVQISHSDPAELQRAADRLADLPIDGLIIVRIGHVSTGPVALPPRLPVTACDTKMSDRYPSVNADERQGVKDVMEHLLELGHTTIGHLAGPADSYPSVMREKAFQQELKDANQPEGVVWRGDWSIQSGYSAGAEIAKDPDVTAVFCANDEMAFGLLRYFEEHGVRVPEDISVAGFDGTALAKFSTPPLTTVDQNFHLFTKRAVDQLLAQIRGTRPVTLEPELIPVSLVIRESTAARPAVIR